MAEVQHTTEESGFVRARETDSLHEALQSHIAKCDPCRNALDKGGARGFGQKARMCPGYFEIVEMYAQGKQI